MADNKGDNPFDPSSDAFGEFPQDLTEVLSDSFEAIAKEMATAQLQTHIETCHTAFIHPPVPDAIEPPCIEAQQLLNDIRTVGEITTTRSFDPDSVVEESPGWRSMMVHTRVESSVMPEIPPEFITRDTLPRYAGILLSGLISVVTEEEVAQRNETSLVPDVDTIMGYIEQQWQKAQDARQSCQDFVLYRQRIGDILVSATVHYDALSKTWSFGYESDQSVKLLFGAANFVYLVEGSPSTFHGDPVAKWQ